ncbi:MAG: hypothetical protein IJ589_08770, partial [Lachnospiraceae bacterium]|nr:hypothetical protein [Lachnospiraceae bacterium]
MEATITSIFNKGYDIWNMFISVSVTLFTTSPTSASGDVYTIAKTLFDAILDISLPIAITFFLIAIIKDVMATPPEQQVRRFFQSTLKFVVLVGILANLWLFMGYIIQVADGITDKLNLAGDYEVHMSTELETAISEICYHTPATNVELLSPGTWFAWLSEKADIEMHKVILILFACGTLIMTIAAGLSIINCAFQRIIKPLVILPFSTITVAMASGSNEAERISTSYLKSFFGLCLSGAFMVVAVNLGGALINGGLIAFPSSADS